jgi:hypothetical protein
MKKIQNTPRLCKSSLLKRSLLLPAALMLSACVVRTQEFHCVLSDNPSQTFEMSMSPTSLVYLSSRLGFTEEKGAHRIYTSTDGRLQASFNVASGDLIAQTGDRTLRWSCKRYDPLQ